MRVRSNLVTHADLTVEGTGRFVDQESETTMLITRSGNVGINTDAPSERLDVEGNVRVRSNIRVNDALRVDGLLDTSNIVSRRNHLTVKSTNVHLDSSQFTIGDAMRLDSTVLAMNRDLSVSGNAAVTNALHVSNIVSDGLSPKVTVNNSLQVETHGVFVRNSLSVSEFLNVDKSITCSNIRIEGDFEILGDISTVETKVKTSEVIAASNIGTDTVLKVIQYGQRDIAQFIDNTTMAMVVKDGGNVGINVENPTEKLEVNGNAIVRSDLLVDHDLHVTNKISSSNAHIWGDVTYVRRNGDVDSLFDTFETKNVAVSDTVYTSNVVNENIDFSLKSSNVLFDSKKVLFNDTFSYDSEEGVRMGSNLSVAGNTYVDDTVFCSNLEVSGTLRLLGNVETIDTRLKMTERLAVSNDGTGPALEVIQTGEHDIAQFVDDATVAMIIKDGGFVGINTVAPTEQLEVNGSVRVTSNVYANKLTLQEKLVAPIVESGGSMLHLLAPEKVHLGASNVTVSADLVVGDNMTVNGRLNVDVVSSSSTLRLDVPNVDATGSLSIQGSAAITDELYTSNIRNTNIYDPLTFISSDVRFETSSLEINNALNVDASGVRIANNLSVSETVFVEKQMVTSNMLVRGDLEVLGSFNMINTDVYVSEILATSNSGTGPALNVTQTGFTDIARFNDGDALVMVIKDGGNVGINTELPSERLTVDGNALIESNVIVHGGVYTSNLISNSPTLEVSATRAVFKTAEFNVQNYIQCKDDVIDMLKPMNTKSMNVDGDLIVSGSIKGDTGESVIQINTNGNVGINTSNAFSERLVVEGDVRVTSNMYLHREAHIDGVVYTSNIANSGNRLRIDTARLEVGDSIQCDESKDETVIATNLSVSKSLLIEDTLYASRIQIVGGLQVLKDGTADSNPSVNFSEINILDSLSTSNITSNSNVLTVTSSCNIELISSNITFKNMLAMDENDLHIWTTDVRASSNVHVDDTLFCSNLEVSGELRILGNVFEIDTTLKTTEQFAISNDGTGPALTVIQTGESDIATFMDDGTSALVIKDGGNVGINTDDPSEKLTVKGNVLVDSNMIVNSNVLVGGSVYTGALVGESDRLELDSSNIYVKTGSFRIADTLILSDSNVGISTDLSLAQNIHVSDTVFCSNLELIGDLRVLGTVSAIDTKVNLTERFAISNDGTGPALEVIQTGDTDIARFVDDDVVSMVIKDGGNVGINTDSPTHTLTVDGDVRITSNLYIGKSFDIQETLSASNIVSNSDIMVLRASNIHLVADIFEVGDRIASDATLTTMNTNLSVNGSVAVLHSLHTSNIISDSDRMVFEASNVRIAADIFEVGDRIASDATLTTMNTNLSVNGSAAVLHSLHTSNIVSDSERMVLEASNIFLDVSELDVGGILNIDSNTSTIGNDLVINGDMQCTGDIDFGTLAVENGIHCSNIFSSGNSFQIIGDGATTDMNIMDKMFYNAQCNLMTFSNDFLIKGAIECGSLTIMPFEDFDRTLNMAKSNLTDFFDVEQGLRCPGAYFTPSENVFTSATYFLHEVYLSSNLKIDPVFNVQVQCNGGLRLLGELFGHPKTSNTVWIHDHTDFADSAYHHGEVTFDNVVNYNNEGSKPIYMRETSVDGYWKIFTYPLEDFTCDLIFQSRNNIATAFTDEFDPSIINFTGQHRCTGSFSGTDIDDLVGRIVVSTGEYSDLNNKKIVSINEAIPIVKVCKTQNDQRVFGVVSDEETNDMTREHKIGFIKFCARKKKRNKKYMINSVGEGGIWVCDLNGPLKNGDFISSSGILGYGMKQNDNLHYNHTVAKITCDCDFDLNSKVYKCEEFEYRKLNYKKAFVGCVYKC